ncbi:MAG TPA: hypothetical protein VF238_11060 [Methylomirabilota bacterium]
MSEGVQPVEYVMFGIGEDGNFILAIEPDDEMKARALVHKGSDVMNTYFRNKLAQAMIEEAKANRIVNPYNGGKRS